MIHEFHVHLIHPQEAYKMVDHRLLERALHRTCNLHSGDWNMNVVRKCLYYLSHSAITWVSNSAISTTSNLKLTHLNLVQSQTQPFQPYTYSQPHPISNFPCVISNSPISTLTNLYLTQYQIFLACIISNSPISTLPNLEFSLPNLKLSHFNLTKSQN